MNRTNGLQVERLVRWLTIAAWAALSGGTVLALSFITPFNSNNAFLMSGIGLMIGSVFIYSIRTFLHLVHMRESAFPES